MPSYRRYAKRYYKRKLRQRTFTRFNTYKNRSSKSQAYQIYRLNKKVENLRASTKPELKEWNAITDNQGPQNYLLVNTNTAVQGWKSGDWVFAVNDPLTFMPALDGLSARLSKVIFWGTMRRLNNTNLTANNSSKQFDTFKISGYMRLCVYMLKEPKRRLENASFFFDQLHYNHEGFKAPLNKSCGTYAKILKVKRYRISNVNTNEIPIKFSVNLWKFNKYRPSYIRQQEPFDEDNPVYPKGTICVCADMIQDPTLLEGVTNLQYQYQTVLYSKLLYYDA